MMRLVEAREIIEGGMPRSIERARRLLRRRGCDIDDLGRAVLESADGVHAYAIKADPLAPAGMDFVAEDRL